MDKLSTALNQFSVSAALFFSGDLCGSYNFDADAAGAGHLHFVKRGRARLQDRNGKLQEVTGPAVIFFPGPATYRLSANESDGVQIVCAKVRYGAGSRNPIAAALPSALIVQVDEVPGLASITTLLIDEAFNERNAREAMMNRLLEMIVISLIRHVMESKPSSPGMLAGLAHPRLSKAILAIHEAPQKNWSIEKLANRAAMSRSSFSKAFHEWVGVPAGEYIIKWRVAIAQEYLRQGKPVDWVANAIGYETSSAFAKTFRKQTGFSPKGWLKAQAEIENGAGS